MRSRRGKNRRKRIMIAYLARAGVALALVIMLVLMWCGCLYIHEHLFQKDSDKDPKNVAENEIPDTTDNELEEPDEPDPVPQDAAGIKIVLDAGHGGNDGGTVGTNAIEKEINLAVVLKMKTLLEERGAEVILTRDEDEWCDLSERSYISNQTGADLFVSMHCNAFEDDPSIAGLECYHHAKSDISKGYAESIVQSIEQSGNIQTRYAMAQNYQVLRDSTIPAVLIEMGYLSNPTDCQNLISDDYQTLMAQTVVDAIVSLFTTDAGITVNTTS